MSPPAPGPRKWGTAGQECQVRKLKVTAHRIAGGVHYDPPMRRVFTILSGIITTGWTLWTLFLVARFGGAVLLDPSTTSRIWAVRNDNDITSAIGLTYHGIPGAVLVSLELILIFASLILAVRQRLTPRRAGLVGLGAWSLLWLVNALWMERLAGGDHAVLTIPIAIATLIVLAFGALRWRANGSAEPQA